MWVVAGNGYIDLDVGGIVFTSAEVVTTQGTVTWTPLGEDGKDIVHGLGPDGVAEVTLSAADNTSTTVSMNENVYGALLNGHFRSDRFVGPTGTVEFGPAVS